MGDPRSSRTTRSRALSPQPHYNSDSSRKRRKYIPGGPGGGGQFIGLSNVDSAQESTSRLQPPRMSDTVETPATTARSRRDPPSAAPTYSSAAAAASQANDYKPREEKSWEEFHPDLDIDAPITIFSADEVDGIIRHEHLGDLADELSPVRALHNDELSHAGSSHAHVEPRATTPTVSPFKRRPGRPPRRPESMLTGLGSPPTPRILPLPTQNPKERLNLPKPSFRKIDTFTAYEADRDVQVNYVDSQMANAGFQESELFLRSDKNIIRFGETMADEHILLGHRQESGKGGSTVQGLGVTQVEYDMDEQDQQWLDAYNSYRKSEGVPPIKPAIFEIIMTQIEKEWHALEKRIPKPNPKPPQTQRPRSSSAAAVNGEAPIPGEEQDSKCAVCDDGDCENTNAIVFCDGCDLAVHQECYGVPFIPEGQWLCRKCQMIGRGVPTCIFCPNTDGAFKLTNESRWVHLLCAIWIPEVSLGNTTFMEPIMDVAKVPKQRWKLNCYICNQKMGACIQCGNKNCYQAFHVSCARRAKLYLKMKSTHGGPSSIDASVLKALCDKHVPAEWRNEHNVDAATAKAKRFYRKTMKGRQWADSQQAALAQLPSYSHFGPADTGQDIAGQDSASASPHQKRKRQQLQKHVWRLPSGAPIIPRTVFNNVESSLTKFEMRRRKDLAGDVCKYWTLKREARRGASLLKRLQLQLDTFSSTEIARRDFAGMGAVGGPRLQRRIDFAEQLLLDMEKLRRMCSDTKERESLKLQDAELLKSLVDTVYFPITPLLWPILNKAQRQFRLDTRGLFRAGFRTLRAKLEARTYTSVASFSVDLGSVLQSVVGLDVVGDAVHAHDQLSGKSVRDVDLTADQKEVKKLAKRIVKAIQQPLEEATRKEAELGGRPFEKELRDLEALLDSSVTGMVNGAGETGMEASDAKAAGDIDRLRDIDRDGDVHMEDATVSRKCGRKNRTISMEQESSPKNPNASELVLRIESEQGTISPSKAHAKTGTISPNSQAQGPAGKVGTREHDGRSLLNDEAALVEENISGEKNTNLVDAPLTPPNSEKDKDLLAPLTHGGIPWYLETFDPSGTTIHEERWTGREVMRGMSEELSELGEEELNGLGVVDSVAQDLEDQSAREPPKKKKKRRSFW